MKKISEATLKDIKELEKSLKPGDVVLYGPSPVKATGLARVAQRAFDAGSSALQGEFTHSGIYAGNGKTIEAFAGKGVGEHKLKDIGKGRKITIIRPKLSEKTRLKAVENARSQIGKQYGLSVMLQNAKNLLIPSKSKDSLKRKGTPTAYSCSTLITDSYRRAGAKVVDTDIDVAAPVDLVSSSKNKIYTMTDMPDERLVISQSAKKALTKAKRFLKKAESVSYSSSHSEATINGDTTFSGHRVLSNGKIRGLKYKGRKHGPLLEAQLQKLGAFSPLMMQQLGSQAGNMYAIGRTVQGAKVNDNYRSARRRADRVSSYSRSQYKKYKARKGFRKLGSEQTIFNNGNLKIIAHPETYSWMPSRDIIEKIGSFLHRPMCIRMFPRNMVFEVYDSEHPNPLPEEDYYKFRAYTSGSKATTFVDDTETPESALWVILHELAHMDMKASPYLLKAYTLATPPDYNESDEAHERDPEEQMANLVATKWLGQCGCKEVEYARPWWRARVDAKCSMEKDASFRISDPYDTMRYTDGNLSSLSDRELAEAIRRESKDASKNDFFISTTDKGLAKSQLLKLENEKKRRLEKQAGAGLVFMQKYYAEHPDLLREYLSRPKKGIKKEAANVVALAAGVAVGTVAVYDYFKSRGMESAAKTVEEEISKKQVNSKQYIRSKDPRVKVITSLAEAKPMLNEIKDKADRDMTERQLSRFFSTGESNAFAFRAKGEYIIAHPKCNSIALDHELGHIHDFRAQNISMLGKHKYNKDPLKQFLFKKNYREGMYQAEVEAWDRAKIKEDHRLRSAALDTYDKSFHRNRMSVAAPTAVGLLLYGAK